MLLSVNLMYDLQIFRKSDMQMRLVPVSDTSQNNLLQLHFNGDERRDLYMTVRLFKNNY